MRRASLADLSFAGADLAGDLGLHDLGGDHRTLLEAAEEDLLAFYRFPQAHWPKLRSTNNIERVNKEIARRSDVVGIFPNDASAIRLVGALLIEQTDEWLLTRGYLSKESISLVLEETGVLNPRL